MTLEEAENIIAKQGCTYYDHTDKTLEEWHESLANSEVNNYTFLRQDWAKHVINGVTYLKQYIDHTVYTYELRYKEQ